MNIVVEFAILKKVRLTPVSSWAPIQDGFVDEVTIALKDITLSSNRQAAGTPSSPSGTEFGIEVNETRIRDTISEL